MSTPEQFERTSPPPVPRVRRTRPARRPRATVGGVIGTSLSVWGRNLVPFLALTLLVFSPHVALQLWLVGQPAGTDLWTAGFVAGAVLQFLLGYLVTGALIHGVFQELRGRRASLGELIARGAARVPAVIAVAIVVGILSIAPVLPGLLLAFADSTAAVLLLLPGGPIALVIYCGLFVALPASVVERPGVFGAVRRSWILTRGSKWTVLGIFLLYLILSWLFAAVLGAVLMLAQDELVVWAQIAATILTTSIHAVLVAVAYHDLRVSKEGIGTEELAAIFD